MDFQSRYNKLNSNQKKAVDTIDGPVMVIAGPGTGKTELLSMRAANILRKTDTLPENILCLTFTDSGAHAMRERLSQIIGKDAYKVAIHTFHSFGSEVINQNGEFFYHGAHFRPADELATHEIIRSIFDGLDYTNPLASKMNGEYTQIRSVISAISDLKGSGLTSDELLHILDTGDATLDAVERDIAEIFSSRISKSTASQLDAILKTLSSLEIPELPSGITPLVTTLSLSLSHAVDEATESNSTKPITNWKTKWLAKDKNGSFVFKDRARHDKLRSVSYVYFQYLARMQESELYDFDDMILRVVHALEVFDDLRLNLQEKYQYIMVDEFQDTNLAQMRILANLTNNPAHGDTPNILVVGDDDQAIFSFQGADVGNILTFRSQYPKAVLIPLVDNYRSGKEILDTARAIITQGTDRLENHINELDKALKAHVTDSARVELYEIPTIADERVWLAETIQKQIEQGTSPNDIAVLARKHKEITELLPFLADKGIAVNYERRDNVFDLAPIKLLVELSRFITLLMDQRLDDADRMLPEILAHPAWGIESYDLWKLSIKAYDDRKRWLDTMETFTALQPIHQWIIDLTAAAQTESLEHMLDLLTGSPSDNTDSVYPSPLYEYFFSPKALQDNPDLYLRYLEGLRTIRTSLRDHSIDETLTLRSFVAFVDLFQQTGSTLTSIHQPAMQQTDAIHLMTAHKSKGLEFPHVFIVGAVDNMWGERVSSAPSRITYPENLPLAKAGDSPDERLRLFFVAATRAKQYLTISYARTNETGKSLDRASFLLSLDPIVIPTREVMGAKEQHDTRWYAPILEPKKELNQLLLPTLERYKLSTTHLGNFLDVTRGGPQAFLVHNLLRFPQAMSPAAAYGSAVHAALQRTHAHLAATGKQRATEDILHDYETELSRHRLSKLDMEVYGQKGIDTLSTFLRAKYDTFTTTQKVELNFAGQQSIVGGAHLTGKLDLVDIDPAERSITLTDYKTGHPAYNWKGSTDYEKIKLHRYRQQLMFYKLLVENSRDYNTYSVERGILQFVEPTKDGQILALEDDFSPEELEEFQKLITIVWNKITTLDLPDVSSYEPAYKGILAFEKDLIDGNI